MKNQKKFILVFALFWVVGLFGGYYLGVGSGILPNETVEYNYFLSENNDGIKVESVEHSSDSNEEVDESSFNSQLRNLNLFTLPQKVILLIFKPQACNQNRLQKNEEQQIA